MRTLAAPLALAAAGLLSPTGTAQESMPVEIFEMDIPGRILEVQPGPRRATVLVEAAPPHTIWFGPGGRLAATPVEDEATRVNGTFTNLLPQSSPATGGRGIRDAWLSDATERYGHAVLGDALEAAGLRVRMEDGTQLVLPVGEDAVFEDLVPRLADLDGDGRDEVLVVKSYLDQGAALAVVGLDAEGALVILGETPPIGRPRRWLNPIGAADFDGDGAMEIAYVETPHIGGRLMVWEWRDGQLLREQSETGFSNHAIGSTELGLAAITDIDGDGVKDLAVPGNRRDRLHLLILDRGPIQELAEIRLDGTIATAIAPVAGHLVFGFEDGRLMALRLPHQ